MARKLLSTKAVLEELDEDFDVPYLEDVADDNDDDSNSTAPPHLPVIHQAQALTPSLAGPLLSHQLPSLLLAHQWVLRLTSQSHQLTPLILCLHLIFWTW